MNLLDDLGKSQSVFLDTAPIIYYIEAHPQFGPLVKEIVTVLNTGSVVAYSSVITLTEVLPKPIQAGNEKLARRFAGFLRSGKNVTLLQISENMAERAGRLRGRYPGLKTMDAIQISAALEVDADVFVTNDIGLKNIKEIRPLILKDYLET